MAQPSEMTGRGTRSSGRRPGGSLFLALATAGVLVLIATASVAFVLWPRWPGMSAAPDAPSLPITVAGVVFNVPPAAIRMPLQRRAGPQDRIDLVFLWPALTPPDPTAKPTPEDQGQSMDRLFMSVSGLNAALTPAERMRDIYPRYLVEGQFTGPDGLMVRRFRNGTPYQGDDLFFDPAAPAAFIARCSRPGAGDTPGICLFERRLYGTVDVTVRFPRDWLSQWRNLADSVDHLIREMRPPTG